MQLGDLSIAYGQPPAKLVKALAVVGEYLHPVCDRLWQDDISKDSCVLVSHILRDYLYRLGFRDAEARACTFRIEADRIIDDKTLGEQLHSLAIGPPKHGLKDTAARWSGHMVAIAGGWLVDATLYQAQRAQWAAMPGMLACPVNADQWPDHPWGKVLAGFMTRPSEDVLVRGMWIDQPENRRWRTAPDLKKGGVRERRRLMAVNTLVDCFGSWKD